MEWSHRAHMRILHKEKCVKIVEEDELSQKKCVMETASKNKEFLQSFNH